MGNEITYLTIPDDVAVYARRFGAQRDTSGQWYTIGDVPRELLNFVPRTSNPRFYEQLPPCPKCGASMRKYRVKSGDVLLLCSAQARTSCNGLIRYEDYLQKAAPVKTLGDFLPHVGTLLLPAAPQHKSEDSQKPKLPHPLHKHWAEIVRRAFEVIGNERQVMLWLQQPKVALRLKAPIQMLGSLEGCAKVARLLEELHR